MKTVLPSSVVLRVVLVGLASVLLGGCWKERLAWSPDGRHLALITADGLQIADAEGRITPLLAPAVYRAA